MLGANIFAMDDLLQAITLVKIPQLCIIANGVYKSPCLGVISCAYRSLSTVHIDILTMLRLFHFKQHIVADFDIGTGNCTVASGQRTLRTDLNFSACSVNVHYNFSGRIVANIPAADGGGSLIFHNIIRSIIRSINGNIVLYGDRYISVFTSDGYPSPVVWAFLSDIVCCPDGRMALNGDRGVYHAIANGRAAEPGCRDMDIFFLCGSPGRANGHLCFGVLGMVSGSADGGTPATATVPTATVCNDRCMVTDHDALCRATVIGVPPRSTAAADGSANCGGCRHLGMPLDGDLFCISRSSP